MMYNKDAIKIMKAGVKMTEKKRFIPLIIAGCVLILILVCLGCTFAYNNGDTEYESYLKDIKDVPENAVYIFSDHSDGACYEGGLSDLDYFYSSVVERSTAMVVAEFDSFEMNGDLGVWKFKKLETLYGDVPEETIIFDELYGLSSKNSETYIKGNRYLLSLQKRDTVFYDTPTYDPVGALVVNLTDLKTIVWHDGVISLSKNADAKDLVTFIVNFAKERGYDEEPYLPEIFRNEKLETVAKECDLIVKVRIKAYYKESKLPYKTHSCEILEVLKGECSSDGEIHADLISDVAAEGDELILLLSRKYKDADSYYYTLASKDGMIFADDESRVKIIEKAVSE